MLAMLELHQMNTSAQLEDEHENKEIRGNDDRTEDGLKEQESPIFEDGLPRALFKQ